MTAGRLARLEQAFRVACGELGHCAAAWLFVREVAQALGDAGVEGLRDELGRSYPVLDAVARRWFEGHRAPHVQPEGVVAACAGAARVLVVGLEAAHLDALVPLLPPDVRLGLVRSGALEADWERVLANFGGRVEGADLGDFQRWAGARSALLTFAYGVHDGQAHVSPAWVRVSGPDVRAQFRALVAWDVLRAPTYVHPRWLVAVPLEDFSHVVGP
ncbi:MAG: hypothetical protein KIT58_06815 [Planctomycetota bacterium]|nr:hypothetical protein [Planctomycetota bacterium]